jgi:hypothetical protein
VKRKIPSPCPDSNLRSLVVVVVVVVVVVAAAAAAAISAVVVEVAVALVVAVVISVVVVPFSFWEELEFFSSPSRPEPFWCPRSLLSNGYPGRKLAGA